MIKALLLLLPPLLVGFLTSCHPAVYSTGSVQGPEEPLYPTTIPTSLSLKATPAPALTVDEKNQFNQLLAGMELLNAADKPVAPPAGETAVGETSSQVQNLVKLLQANCSMHPMQRQSDSSSNATPGSIETSSSNYGMDGDKCPLLTKHTSATDSTIESNESNGLLISRLHIVTDLSRTIKDLSIIPGLTITQQTVHSEAFGKQIDYKNQTQIYLKRKGAGQLQFAPKKPGDDPIVAPISQTEEYLKKSNGNISVHFELTINYQKTIYQISYTSEGKSAGTTDAHVYLNGEEMDSNPFFQLSKNHWQKSNSNEGFLTPIFNSSGL
jgi:hypothetical protein